MPVIIEELSTTLHVQNEPQIRQIVREEIERYLERSKREAGRRGLGRVDPADPGAAGRPEEGSGG